jgi:Protein of unknown function (DUF3127).
MLTYRGFLKTKGTTIKVSEKFRKREFVVTDNAQSYPQSILFQLTQDRCELLDRAEVGQEIEVHFLLKGREWKNPQGEIKTFNSLDVFRIEVLSDAETNFSNETLVPTPDDDLPF